MPALGRDDDFGIEMIIRWVSGQIKLSRDGAAEVDACALVTESDIRIDPLPDGRWVITNLAADGSVQRRYATNEVSYA